MRAPLHIPLLLGVCLLQQACGRTEAPESGSPLSIYGPLEETVLGAPVRIEPVREGLRLLPRDTGPTSPSVTLAADGRSALQLSDGTVLHVRELGARGAPSALRGSIGFEREGGRSYWSVVNGALEEWIDVAEGVAFGDTPAVVWEVDGASLRSGPAGVEVVDANGVARARVTAPSAWDADGEPVPVRLAVEDGRLALYADADGRRVLVDPVWVPTNAMLEPRTADETADIAAVLPGAVLAIGGGTPSNPHETTSVERYDIATGVWSAAPSLAVARSGHTVSLLPDGRVLVAGGVFTDRVERFDPTTSTWTEVARMGNGRRASHAATLLDDGTLLVSGGWSGTMRVAGAERYDPATDSWRPAGTLSQGRFWHTATRLPDGRVLVAGGSLQGGLTPSAEIYDPATNAWTVVASLSFARCRHRAALLPDGRVLVVGGLTGTGRTTRAEIYDPASNRWTATGSLAQARDYHSATTLPDGTVLVAGGYGPSGEALATTEIYVPGMGSFRAGPTMAEGRYDHLSALLPGGRVLVAGGQGAVGVLASSEVLIEDTCGNGVVDGGEGCDDGNRRNGDCCSALCSIEVAGTVCRPGAAPCDAAEVCDGVTTTCPADALAVAGVVCRPAGGPCDIAEACTGASAACPAERFVAEGTECRPVAGPCDVVEACTGASAACPVDTFVATGTECRAATDLCDVAEECSGSSASCPVDAFAPGGTECRPAAGPCDLAETCSGASSACGADALAAVGTVCRARTDACDVEESCTGMDAACPDDRFAPASTECRASAGPCDLAELCTGGTPACPVDTLAGAGATCRAAVGECDVAELCSGGSAACPPDAARADGTSCGPSPTDPCDVPDVCVGSIGADARCESRVASSGTACGTSSCTEGTERTSSCDGTSAMCPPATNRGCEPFACGASSCRTRCDADADCAPGYACEGEDCVPVLVDAGTPMLDAGADFDAGDGSDVELDASVDAARLDVDAGSDPTPTGTAGCGCRTSHAGSAPFALLGGWIALLALRRRPRRRVAGDENVALTRE